MKHRCEAVQAQPGWEDASDNPMLLLEAALVIHAEGIRYHPYMVREAGSKPSSSRVPILLGMEEWSLGGAVMD